MSVKDKIAMWNNMATSSPNPPKNNVTNNAANMVRTQPVQHVYEPVVEKKSMVETAVIVKPSDLKKKAQLEQGQPQVKAPEYVVKPVVKPTEPPKKETTSNYIADTPPAPKPSDIKKMFEQQISGNNFHIIAPVTIKKTESTNIIPEKKEATKVEYEIERDIPIVSVKQNAEKFGQFYQKKAEEYNKPKEVVINPPQDIAQPHVETVETPAKVQVQEIKHELPPKIEQTPVFPSPSHQQKTPEIVPSVPAPQVQVKQQTHNHEDVTLRLKNRNKKKRINFDSDDD